MGNGGVRRGGADASGGALATLVSCRGYNDLGGVSLRRCKRLVVFIKPRRGIIILPTSSFPRNTEVAVERIDNISEGGISFRLILRLKQVDYYTTKGSGACRVVSSSGKCSNIVEALGRTNVAYVHHSMPRDVTTTNRSNTSGDGYLGRPSIPRDSVIDH